MNDDSLKNALNNDKSAQEAFVELLGNVAKLTHAEAVDKAMNEPNVANITERNKLKAVVDEIKKL